MDFHELVIAGDLWSIGIRNHVVDRRTEDPTLVVTELLYLLKEKHIVVGGRGQSCHNLTPIVVGGTRPEVLLSTDVSVISLISSNLRCMDSTINRVLLCSRSGSLMLRSSSLKNAWSVLFKNFMPLKSTSGACQLLGGKLVCWSAKKQQSVAMSSAEAEYVAAAGCCANILWMKSQLTDYDIIYEKVPIFCDNTSAIAISNNPVLHSRTKHIDIRYHFIRDHILKGDIELHFIPTQYQLADIFTKPLDEPTFKRLIVELGMLNIDSKPEASVLTEEN
ncbi:hypothetical protein Tco_0684362 [Tanacetum coccineum]